MKNLNTPSIYDRGFIGEGQYKPTHKSKRTEAYRAWTSMFLRCYDAKFHLSNPTYKGCTVHPNWFNFQNFAKWFYENYKEGFQLDKDIKFKGNKVYSEHRCTLVPKFINGVLSARGNDRGSLPIGVIYHKAARKFVAQIDLRGKRKHLGSYDNPKQAFNAYKEAKEDYIKEVAEEYKNVLESMVYECLVRYEIEIHD